MADLTSKLLAGIKPGIADLYIYHTRIADMNDAQCRLALMWLLSNMPPENKPDLNAMFGIKDGKRSTKGEERSGKA